MPIAVRRHGKQWLVINTETNKVHGRHPNSMRAKAQMRAMAANGVDMTGEGEHEPKKEQLKGKKA